MIMTVWG